MGKAVKRIYTYLRPYSLLFFLAAIFMALEGATNSLLAFLVKPALDDVFLKKDLRMLKLVSLSLVFIYLGKCLFEYLRTYIMGSIGFSIVTDLRNRMFEKCQELPLSYYSSTTTGEITSRFLYDAGLLENTLTSTVSKYITSVFTIAALLFVVFYRDYKLATFSVLTMPIFVHIFTKLGKKMRRKSKKAQELMGSLTSILNEVLKGIRIVKAFCMERREIERFKRENAKVLKTVKRIYHIYALSSPSMEFIGGMGVAAIVLYGGYQTIKGATTPGNFFSFLTALAMLYKPVKTLSKAHNNIQRGLAALDRIEAFLRVENPIKNPESPAILKGFNREISYENVSFTYDGKRFVLKDVNITIKKGEVVAVVGRSGSGKSTFLNLLLRFYDPTYGSITIDGIDIREVDIKSLRSLIGLVTQETILFNDTVKANIAYGRPDASFQEIVEAAKAAYAHDFIVKLPKGYETVVGEGGAKLSGGERQRIAIARAVLKDPPILLLDEPTSNLDLESENMVLKALERLMEGRTTIVVTHRMTLAERAHKVLFMDGGRITGVGSHKDLLEREDGLYRRFCEMGIS